MSPLKSSSLVSSGVVCLCSVALVNFIMLSKSQSTRGYLGVIKNYYMISVKHSTKSALITLSPDTPTQLSPIESSTTGVGAEIGKVTSR